MSSESLARDLARVLPDARISTRAPDRSAYAHDLWPGHLIATRAGAERPQGPAAIVWPETDDELAALVAFAGAHGVRLTPFGAGSGVVGGLWLDQDVIAVDLKRMRRIRSLDVAAGTATVDAGMLGEHLEDALQFRGATLGHFPSSISCSTVGGWVATRGAGQCSGRYGKIEDMVLGVEGILPTGEAYAAGAPRPGDIDTRALLVGSEGLFGFLTRATLRIWPAPVERRFLSFSFASVREGWEAMRAIYQQGLRPAVARLYDPFDTYVFRTGGKSAHGPSRRPAARHPLRERFVRTLLDRPEWLNQLNDAVGGRVFGRSLLVLVFEAAAGEPVDEAARRTASTAQACGGHDEGETWGRKWLERRHAVSYRASGMYAGGAWVDTMEIAAPWAHFGAMYDAVRETLADAGFVMAHLSHAYPDGCSVYFTFAGASPDDHRARERYEALWERALAAAHQAGGTVAHHHGIGRSKKEALALELGAGTRWFSDLARACDPLGVMQQGVLVPEKTRPAEAGPVLDAPVLDAVSGHLRAPAHTPCAALASLLAPGGLVIEGLPLRGTIGAHLASRPVESVLRDPVDHVVAGFTATLRDGTRYRVPASPRRACGPDLATLAIHGAGKFGALEDVTLRVTPMGLAAPWTPTFHEPERNATHPALAGWLDRASR